MQRDSQGYRIRHLLLILYDPQLPHGFLEVPYSNEHPSDFARLVHVEHLNLLGKI